MDLDIRWVWLDDTKVYLSATARGTLRVEDFKEILRRVGEAFTALDGHTLIDLRQAAWDPGALDLNAIVGAFAESRLRMDNKIALVYGRDLDHYGQLLVVASGASNQGFKTRAFYDFDAALAWLKEAWDND